MKNSKTCLLLFLLLNLLTYDIFGQENNEEVSADEFKGHQGVYIEIKSKEDITLGSIGLERVSVKGSKLFYKKYETCSKVEEKCWLPIEFFKVENELSSNLFIKIVDVSNGVDTSLMLKDDDSRLRIDFSKIANKKGINFYLFDGSGKAKIISKNADNLFRVTSEINLPLKDEKLPKKIKEDESILPYDLLPYKEMYFNMRGTYLKLPTEYLDENSITKDLKFYNNPELKGTPSGLDELKETFARQNKYVTRYLYGLGGENKYNHFFKIDDIAQDRSWIKITNQDKSMYLDARICLREKFHCAVLYYNQSKYELERMRLEEIKSKKALPFFEYLRKKIIPCIDSKDIKCIQQYFVDDSSVYTQKEDDGCWNSSVIIPKYKFKLDDLETLRGCLEYEALLPSLAASKFNGKYCVFAPDYTQAKSEIRLLTISKDQKDFLTNYFDIAMPVSGPLPETNKRYEYSSYRLDVDEREIKELDIISLNLPDVQEKWIKKIDIYKDDLPDLQYTQETIEYFAKSYYKFNEALPEHLKDSTIVKEIANSYGPIYKVLIEDYANKSTVVHPDYFQLPGYMDRILKRCAKGGQYDLRYIVSDSLRAEYLNKFAEVLKSETEIYTNNSCYPAWVRTDKAIFELIQKNPYWITVFMGRDNYSLKFTVSAPSYKMERVTRKYIFKNDMIYTDKDVALMETEAFQKQLFIKTPFYISQIDPRVKLNEEWMKKYLSYVYDPSRFFTEEQEKQQSVQSFLKAHSNKTKDHLDEFMKWVIRYHQIGGAYYFMSIPDTLAFDLEFTKLLLKARKKYSDNNAYISHMLLYKGSRPEVYDLIYRLCEQSDRGTYSQLLNKIRSDNINLPEGVKDKIKQYCQ